MMDAFLRAAGIAGLGAILVAAIAGIVWQFFKWFGAKWIDARFAKSLEAFKHQQAQEIERLRGQIATLLDRATKLHAQEFDVLPAAWDKLSLAMGRCLEVLANVQSYPDVSKMSPVELEAFLDELPFQAHQRSSIREADRLERTRQFQDLMQRHRLSDAFEATAEFHNYVIQKAIFIQPVLRTKLKELSAIFYSALFDQRMVLNDGLPRAEAEETRKKVFAAGAALQNEIEEIMSNRLWGEVQGSGLSCGTVPSPIDNA